MNPVNLSQMIETLFGAPAADSGPAANAASFSSVLAGATGNPTDAPDDAIAVPPSSPIATPTALATANACPGAVIDTAKPDLASLPALPREAGPGGADTGDDKPQQDVTPAPAIAEAQDTEPARQQQPVGVPEDELASRAGSARSGRTAGKAATKLDSAEPSGSEPEHLDKRQPDPAALTIQQALAAVASLAVTPKTSDQQQQFVSSKTSAAPWVSNVAATPTGRVAQPAARTEVTSLEDSKLPVPKATPMTSVQSHNLAVLLEQHGLTTAQVRGAERPAASAAGSHFADVPSQTQSSDLHQLDALVRDIAEVSGATGRAAMRLTADQLGPLEIRLHRSDAGMTVTIRTESEQSHSTVVQAQQQLSDDMRANGVKVAATSVMLGHGGAERERQDRQPMPFGQPIEAAASETDQSETRDEQRPAGRYA